jgi:hypothetical protein
LVEEKKIFGTTDTTQTLLKKGNVSEKKTEKVPVRDLRPTTDAKGGRHGHHSHRQLGAGGKGSNDKVERAGKYWL